jgi:hypothetical protein
MFQPHYAPESKHRTVVHALGWEAGGTYLPRQALLVVGMTHGISCSDCVYEFNVI